MYDDIADRWYVSAFDSNDSGLFLAVSVDGNPLDGFLPTYHLTDVGGFPDYQKMGFNKDAIFISYNDFGTGGAAATIASIDKAAALSGTLTYFVSHPAFQFRAMPPAQMHGDTTGGVEWFVSTDGTDAGGNTIRVTKMTNYLSNSPIFTYTSLPVTPYQTRLQRRSARRQRHHLPEHDDHSSPVPQRAPGDGHGFRHRVGWVRLSQGALLPGRRVGWHADAAPAGRDRSRSGRGGPDAVRG